MADKTVLVIGRGEVYFDRFAPGTRVGEGELYIGNTSSFAVGRDIERLDRFTAYKGQKIKGASAFISETHTITFRTDNLSPENAALWYGGEPTLQNLVGNLGDDTPVVETLTIKRGRYYQLGLTVNRTTGLRLVKNVSVTFAGNVISMPGNYEVAEQQGRIRILPKSVLADGAVVAVHFEWISNIVPMHTAQPKDQFGALRFVGTAGYGPQKNYFYPMVRLSASGTVELKSDDWQALQFTADALKRDALSEIVYVQHIDTSLSDDDLAILNLRTIDADTFPYWENILNDVVDIAIPAHSYV